MPLWASASVETSGSQALVWGRCWGSALHASALCLAGGEIEEAELTSWHFVPSAFSLDLSNTKRHLVPGAPFLLQVILGGRC